MKHKNKTKKGFSLVETLVAVSIFSFLMVTIVGVFSNLLKNYTIAKKTQKNIENAQYAMNLIAKTIRTSNVPAIGAPYSMTTFGVFDYSQGECIQYEYDSLNKKIQVATTTDVATDLSGCVSFGSIPATSYSDLANNIASANISAVPTVGATLGKVTISLEVQNDPSQIPIQMSVSLRQ